VVEIDQLIPEALGGVERIRVRTFKDNTVKLAVTYYRWTLSVALPPRGGGLGWGGGKRQSIRSSAVPERIAPHPGPPPRGGRGS
jgi:hypothetical protein